MDKPLVSAIIIFLNEERFIREAIDSVFAQTCENWELLLIDDGSHDGSTDIARRFAAENPGKVRYFEHEGHQNRGMSVSRNLGVRHAMGQYIAFLDADDVWLPEKLEQQVAILNSQPEAAMVCGPVQWWYSWTGDPGAAGRDRVVAPDIQADTLVPPPQLLSRILANETVTTTSGLLRRDMIESVGGFEESFHGLYEDQVFCAKLCSRAPVFVASRCWYRWRKHPNSCCSVAVRTGQYSGARLGFLQWLEKFLSEQRIENREVWEALGKEFWKCHHPHGARFIVQLKRSARRPKQLLKILAKFSLPTSVQECLRARLHGPEYLPPVGGVDFGNFRRSAPFSRVFGFDRGRPIDRHYIERFLVLQASDIRGRVLEIGDDTYTQRFGGDRVTQADVLHAAEGNPKATLVADLTRAENIPSNTFDCIICTQTLMFIYNVQAAIRTLYRILKPGGVLLATVAGVSHQISRHDMERWGDYWRFTSLSTRLLFQEAFPAANVSVKTYGNVLAATAFLQGLVVEDFRVAELDRHDPDYEVSIAIRAVKPMSSL